MKRFIKFTIPFAVIAMASVYSLSGFHLPELSDSYADSGSFSTNRALNHIRNISQRPHPVGFLDHDRVRDYIINEISRLGLIAQTQKEISSNTVDGKPVSAIIENIYVEMKGTGHNGKSILVMTHYDSTPGGPGAADDGIGVSIILELIRSIKSTSPLKNDIVFLISDGEELGLLGSKVFSEKMLSQYNIGMVINIEARGNSGPVIMFETGNDNEWAMKEFRLALSSPLAFSFAYDIYRFMPNNTDFSSFKKLGIQGFNFSSLEGYSSYHNTDDNVDNLDRKTLRHSGDTVFSVLKHFGSRSLKEETDHASIFFTLGKRMFVVYSKKASELFCVILWALCIVTFISGLRKNLLSIKGSLSGLGITIVLLAVSALIGTAASKSFIWFHFGGRELTDPDFITMVTHGIGLTVTVLCGVCLIIHAAYSILSRVLTFSNAIFGIVSLCVIFSTLTTILLNSTSYLFVWPAVLILIGILSGHVIKTERLILNKHFMLLVLAIASSILIFLPFLILLYECVGIFALNALALFAAIPFSVIIVSIRLYHEKSVVDSNK